MSVSSPDPPVRRVQRPVGPGPEVADEVVDVDQIFDANGLYALRETLAAHASRLGADDDQIDHLLIVASELATNVIRHGAGTGRLRLWHQDGMLFCQVSDHGPGITDPASVGTALPDPSRVDGGRGLWICRNLTAQLRIEPGPDGRGTVVTATIPGHNAHQHDRQRDGTKPDHRHDSDR
jgi:anti-sigma regulatory factor (Ser/Thr protein kinase)